MRNKYIEAFENAQIASKNIPDFRAGDTYALLLVFTKAIKLEFKILKVFV